MKIELTMHLSPQNLENPLPGGIIKPFQKPLSLQAEPGWSNSPETQPTG